MTTVTTTLTRRLEIRANALTVVGSAKTTTVPRLDVVFGALSAIHDLLPRYAPREVTMIVGEKEPSSWEQWRPVWDVRGSSGDEGLQRFVPVDWMVLRLTYASPLELFLQAGGASGLLYFMHRFLTTI